MAESRWNNSLNKISWRIDTKTKSRNVGDMNELCSIVEMVLQNPQNSESKVKDSFFAKKKKQIKVLNQ